MKTIIVLCLGLFLAGAQAQPGRAPTREAPRAGPRIILYEQANYRGDSLVLYPGEQLPNLANGRFDGGGRINDRISSIRIEDGAELYVFEDANFGGHVMRVTESIRDLAHRPTPNPRVSWNDRISAVRVDYELRRGGGRPPNPDQLVRRAYEDLFGRAPDPEGLRYHRSLIIDQGWTDRMLRDHLRRSEEFRGPGIDRIIQRAYEDVLRRAPDPSGLRTYRRLLLEEEWTEQQLRDHLRRSDEYRNLPRRN
ncbi:MAG TPA: hypothetical protein PLF88_09365 [Opitutaceae bacterium]|nr:hypothetical protein [Opitutaceae bacterium]HRJ47139.1 hypothetical protein [Opitutaceae bacterium]